MLTIIDTALKNITSRLIQVSLLALSAKSSSACCIRSPAAGTKWRNTKSTSVSRAFSSCGNTGNTESIASTATINGTSDTKVV